MPNSPNTIQQISWGLGKFAGRKENDLAAWQAWKDNPTQDNLEALFSNMAGIINSNVNAWTQQRIPRAALKAEAERLAMKAFKTYNPSLGASLATHLTTRLQKLYGFVARHADLAKIPEERFSGIRGFKAAERNLRERHGRDPSATELADYLKISIPEVSRYRNEDVKILVEGGGSDFSGIEALSPTKRYAMEAVYYGELTPDEKVVYEYIYGKHGRKTVTGTGDIAKLTGMSTPKISRLKKSISKKLEQYL